MKPSRKASPWFRRSLRERRFLTARANARERGSTRRTGPCPPDCLCEENRKARAYPPYEQVLAWARLVQEGKRNA